MLFVKSHRSSNLEFMLFFSLQTVQFYPDPAYSGIDRFGQMLFP